MDYIKGLSVIKNVEKKMICKPVEAVYKPQTPACLNNDTLEYLNSKLGNKVANILIRNIINKESARLISKDVGLSIGQIYAIINEAKKTLKESKLREIIS